MSDDNNHLMKDFRDHLVETSRAGDVRSFAPLRLGEYQISVQASARHRSIPRAAVPPHKVEVWEVAIFSREGRPMRPRDLQPLATDPAFMDCWRGDILELETDAVQILTSVLTFGVDVYYESMGDDEDFGTGTTYDQRP